MWLVSNNTDKLHVNFHLNILHIKCVQRHADVLNLHVVSFENDNKSDKQTLALLVSYMITKLKSLSDTFEHAKRTYDVKRHLVILNTVYQNHYVNFHLASFEVDN